MKYHGILHPGGILSMTLAEKHVIVEAVGTFTGKVRTRKISYNRAIFSAGLLEREPGLFNNLKGAYRTGILTNVKSQLPPSVPISHNDFIRSVAAKANENRPAFNLVVVSIACLALLYESVVNQFDFLKATARDLQK